MTFRRTYLSRIRCKMMQSSSVLLLVSPQSFSVSSALGVAAIILSLEQHTKRLVYPWHARSRAYWNSRLVLPLPFAPTTRRRLDSTAALSEGE
eukprot:6213343-Pleurochrysis_carterae.AAC.12